MELIQTISHQQNSILNRVQFISGTPYIITCSENELFVWNIITLELWWSYKVPIHSFVVAPQNEFDNKDGSFAIITEQVSVDADKVKKSKKSKLPFVLMIFRPSSPIPIKVIPIPSYAINSYGNNNIAFIQSYNSNPKSLSLILLSKRLEIVRYDSILT